MANQYYLGPSLGEAFGRGVKSGLDAYDAQKQRQRQHQDDEWRRELREHQRGLMPLEAERAHLGLERDRLGLDTSRTQHEWAMEDRQKKQQEEVDQKELEATIRAMRALKMGNPDLAVAEYRRFNPDYNGLMPRPDPDNQGHWLLDLDGDGVLDSVNPDDIINFYSGPVEPLKLRHDERLVHPQTGEEIVGLSPRSATGSRATSAALQEADAIAERLMRDPNRDPNKTDDQIWLDAYAQATTAKTRDPAEFERTFYSGVLQKILGTLINPTAEEVANAERMAGQITDNYAQRYGSPAAPRLGLAPPPGAGGAVPDLRGQAGGGLQIPGGPVQPPGGQQAGQQAPVPVSSPEEVRRLRPGTLFVTPDGQVRVAR